jgi:hypothetical protein
MILIAKYFIREISCHSRRKINAAGNRYSQLTTRYSAKTEISSAFGIFCRHFCVLLLKPHRQKTMFPALSVRQSAVIQRRSNYQSDASDDK